MTQKGRGKTRFRGATSPDRDTQWEERFTELRVFRRQHGHCQVASRSKTHPSLGHWVNYQRVLKRSGRLSVARRRRLEEIGFDWISRGRSVEFRDPAYWDAQWELLFNRLTRFHRRFGHCLVPAGSTRTPNLRQWVERQRHLKQEGLLRPDRWRRLRALGLDWKTGESLDPRWTRSLGTLLEFRRRFGHCRVPATWPENINLGRWVVKTRRLKNTGRLNAEKVRRLNEAGFVWDAMAAHQAKHDARWSAWLARLHAFHQRHGHWRVPTEQRRFHRLRVWMDNQRISYHRGWLTAERIRRLQAIKFPWVSDRIAAQRAG